MVERVNGAIPLEVPDEHRVSMHAVDAMATYILEQQLIQPLNHDPEDNWLWARQRQNQFNIEAGVESSRSQEIRLLVKAAEKVYQGLCAERGESAKLRIPDAFHGLEPEVWRYLADYFIERTRRVA